MKIIIYTALLLAGLGGMGANSLVSETGRSSAPPTYEKDIRSLLAAHCLSCHGSRKSVKRQLHTYASVSGKIDDILQRVQLPSSDRKFMPYKLRQPPLSRSEIEVLIAWQASGMTER